ncbi:hypothetical protein JCM10450v2_000362 [Rhodotorula kratochvilovae]
MDSPAATSPRSSLRKRTASSLALDGELSPVLDEPRPKKKRAPRSTAAEKQAKKLARMERNRLAAQVSRDKKKQQAEFLEARIAELEAQVGGNGSSPSSSTASFTPGLPPTPASYTLALPALAAAPDALVERLQQENESLRTELALEKLQSQSLQIRLSALESKFGRLEQLLTSAGSTTTTAAPPMVKQEDALEPTTTMLSPRSTRGRFFPAAEAVPPVVPSFVGVDLDALLGLDFGLAPAAAPVAAPDPVVHQDLGAPDIVAQAWADWAGTLDLTALPQAEEPVVAAPEPEFDLFEFLRQDAAGTAVEAVY